uniref:Si:dkeyp-3f10.16 n=1 Tax=Sparus aurata TaxID=8175 RepID=A0A671UGF6_SPAAU
MKNSCLHSLEHVILSFLKNFITFAIAIIIIFINGTFVYTYFKSHVFQRDPRYVLYIHLVINDMIMLTIAVALQIMAYTLPLKLAPCCILLSSKTFFFINSAPLNLAGMALERYIAVCKPLHHVQICTVQRTYGFITLIWAISLMPSVTDVIFLVATQPLSIFSRNVICYESNISTHLPLCRPQGLLLCFVFLTVLITYLNVLWAARAASGLNQASARNARNTILLHGVQLLICMSSFVFPFIDIMLVTTWPEKRSTILFTTYLISGILPRLLSPLIYGVRDKTGKILFVSLL